MSDEDKLAVAIMDRVGDYDNINTRFHLEEHYNHYGDRGVVDLVEEQWEDGHENNREIWLYEIKSESAVRNATGANEIIRQFNRHRDFFFKGSDYNRDKYYSVKYGLVFYATEYTYEHVKDNEELYRTLIQGNPDSYGGTHTLLFFYHPDAEGYAHYFGRAWGYGPNSRSVLEILGREDEFITEEEYREGIDQ